MAPDQPSIYVELRDGTNTWITYMPIQQLDHVGVESAAGDAFAMFIASLARDREAVDEHMRKFRGT
jgi:hypothetical protein